MGEFKFAKKVPQTDANCILKDFAEHYVDKEKLRNVRQLPTLLRILWKR